MGEDGTLESWEYQGGTFTTAGNWLAVGGKRVVELGVKDDTSNSEVTGNGEIVYLYQNTKKYEGNALIKVIENTTPLSSIKARVKKKDLSDVYIDVDISNGYAIIDATSNSEYYYFYMAYIDSKINTQENVGSISLEVCIGPAYTVDPYTNKKIENLEESVSNNKSDIDEKIRDIIYKQAIARNAFNTVEEIPWESGFYSNSQGYVNPYDTISHAKIQVQEGSTICQVKNISVLTSGKIAILFFKDSKVIAAEVLNTETDSYSNYYFIPQGATHIGINSRNGNKENVIVEFDNKDDLTLHITDENIDDNSISSAKLKGYVEPIKSIKDEVYVSSNLANPKDWVLGYQNGSITNTSDSNYKYINIDVSQYPVGTSFKYLRAGSSESKEIRFAGFFDEGGSPTDTFLQKVSEVEKTSEECVTLSCTIFVVGLPSLEEIGLFVSEVEEFEPYANEYTAIAEWESNPSNDKALLRKMDLDKKEETLTQKFFNILHKKKWVVCGDSFTYGSESGKIESGIYAGKNKVYPYFIGNRNNMDIIQFFQSGKTLAFPAIPGDFTNSLTCPTSPMYYQNIPVDADYITIYLGINDSHHATGDSGSDGEDTEGIIPLGTIEDSDTSTYYGAWNVVIPWLIENRPFAHLGIIVSNGCGKDEYRLAQIEIATKYGVPYIDLNGDKQTPAMIRSTNPAISEQIKTIINNKQGVDPEGVGGFVNLHPNDAAHEFESTFIENFLRSL